MAIEPTIFVISGQLAAGKSSLAQALLARAPFGYHIDVDAIREMVSSGLASPLAWSEETERQFALAIAASAALAAVYHGAGFEVAIEGGIEPEAIDRALAAVGLLDVRVGVELLPPLDVALERNRSRTTKAFDTSALEGVMREIDADIRGSGLPDGWMRIDNGSESLDETVARVLSATDSRRSI
jgi:chloramphenicol 3-O-phosphotransferase